MKKTVAMFHEEFRGHPRYRRFRKPDGYKLLPPVRMAIDARIKQMIANGSPEASTAALLAHLEIEFGRDAIAAYREEVIG